MAITSYYSKWMNSCNTIHYKKGHYQPTTQWTLCVLYFFHSTVLWWYYWLLCVLRGFFLFKVIKIFVALISICNSDNNWGFFIISLICHFKSLYYTEIESIGKDTAPPTQYTSSCYWSFHWSIHSTQYNCIISFHVIQYSVCMSYKHWGNNIVSLPFNSKGYM